MVTIVRALVANTVSRYKGVLFVLLTAAALRFALLGWAAFHNRTPLGVPDAERYHLLALNLLKAHRFALPSPNPEPETLRTPGFPAFLAVVYAVAGPSPYRAAAVLVLVSTALCVVVYAAAYRAFGPRTAVIAGLVMALSPGAVLNAVAMLSDSLHGLLLAVAFLFLQELMCCASARTALWCGLLLGIAALTRPVSLYAPLVLAPALSFAQRSIKPALWLVAGALIVVAPWFGRNYVTVHELTFSTIAEHNLWYHNLSYARARAQGISVDEARRLYARDVQSSGIQKVAARDIKRYWKELLIVQTVGTAMFWVAPDGYQWSYLLNANPKAAFGHDRMWDAGPLSAVRRVLSSPGGLASAVQACYNAMEAVLALTGLLLCVRNANRRALAAASTLWCLYYAVVTSVVSNGRYRLPAEIVMAVFAGAALDWLVRWAKRSPTVGNDSSADHISSSAVEGIP
ncbi:MAG: ArnT family glycosyltransferase [Armatimonadota bacterium]